jgi:hypothetical protein
MTLPGDPFTPPPQLEDGVRRSLGRAARRLPDPPGSRLPAVGGATESAPPVVAADPDDFDAFYSAHRPPVYRALALTLDDRDLATEAVDRGFTTLYRRWRKERGDGPEVFAAARAWALRHEGSSGGSRGFRLDRHTPTDAEAVAAFRDLDEPDRAVLVVRHLLGWGAERAATALGVTPEEAAAHLETAAVALGARLGTDAASAGHRLALALPAEAAAQTVPLSRLDRAKGAVWTRRFAAAGAAAAAVLVLVGGVGLAVNLLGGDGTGTAAPGSGDTGVTTPLVAAGVAGETTELEWNRIPLGPEQGDVSTIGYGPGGFVVMGQTYDNRGSRMMAFLSEDGMEWEAVQLPDVGMNGGWIAQVIGSDDGYAALGSTFDERTGADSSQVWTSADGLTWTAEPLPSEQQGEVAGVSVRWYTYASSIAHTADGYIVFGNQGADIDPEQFLRDALPADVSLNSGWGFDGTRIDVYDGNGQVTFSATMEELGVDPEVAALMSGGRPIAWRSSGDGGWEQFDLGGWIGPNNYPGRVVATDAGLVAVVHQQFGAGLWFSEDGTEWTRVQLDRGATVSDAGTVGDTFVAIGSTPGSGAAWTSTDGATWTRVTDAALSVGYLQQVSSGPSGLAAVASGQGFNQAELPPAVVVQDGFTITVDTSGYVVVTDDTGTVVTERFADEVTYGNDGSLTITDSDGDVIVTVPGPAMNRAWEEVYSSSVVIEEPFPGGSTEEFRLLLTSDGTSWTTVDLTGSIGPGFYPNQVAVGPDAIVLTGWQESFQDFEGPQRPSVWVGTRPSS